jgi:hypothetical protein
MLEEVFLQYDFTNFITRAARRQMHSLHTDSPARTHTTQHNKHTAHTTRINIHSKKGFVVWGLGF